jgi:hypothetical protein
MSQALKTYTKGAPFYNVWILVYPRSLTRTVYFFFFSNHKSTPLRICSAISTPSRSSKARKAFN